MNGCFFRDRGWVFVGMAKHRDYWEKRFEQLEDAQDKKAAAYYAELEKQYRKAANDVQREIEAWYARFADNNELTLQGARKLLNRDELEEFKWSVLDYIEKGKTLNYSDAWAKQLENASTRFHISRLEAIKVQMQNHVEMLYGNELDDITDLMTDIYTEGYYHTAYEIQKGFNIGYDLMKLDENKVAKVLSKPWAADGSNFSDRVWKHKSQLVSELHNGLTQAIIRGQHPSVVTDAIAKRFNVSKRQAGTLVMTESAFFASASNRDCYKDLGVERYEVLATLDRRTSDICQSLDGKVFPMSEYAVGVTAPPFHVRCRTTTVPFFDDEFELDTQRAARNEEGKTYYIPGNMKYEDWKKAFVDGGSKKDLKPITSEEQLKEIVEDAPTSIEKTIDTINEEATDRLLDSYDARRTQFDLNLTSADDLRTMGDMNPVTVNYDGVSLETAKAFDDTIQELSDEYLTGFTKIEVGDKKDFFGANIFATTQHNNLVGQKTLILNPNKTGDYNKMVERIKELSDKGYAVKIAEGLEGRYIATHEFAHSLIDLSGNYKNYIGMDVKRMRGIKGEIDSLFDAYKSEVNALESVYKEKELAFLNGSLSADIDMDELGKLQKEALEAKRLLDDVKISKYSMENADEFMAEAFTQYRIGVSQSRYSDEVMNVIDKHFKKQPLENVGKSSTIRLSNIDVRKKYIEEVSQIKDNIDSTLPIEEQARQAFEARNRIRTEARKLMADEEARKKLDIERPNKTFEELVTSKMDRKGMTREEAIQDIYETATKTNEDVNRELGIGGD